MEIKTVMKLVLHTRNWNKFTWTLIFHFSSHAHCCTAVSSIQHSNICSKILGKLKRSTGAQLCSKGTRRKLHWSTGALPDPGTGWSWHSNGWWEEKSQIRLNLWCSSASISRLLILERLLMQKSFVLVIFSGSYMRVLKSLLNRDGPKMKMLFGSD